MKSLIKTLALAALILLPLTAMTAQPVNPTSDKMPNVVFEVTSDNPEKWLGALRNVENAPKVDRKEVDEI